MSQLLEHFDEERSYISSLISHSAQIIQRKDRNRMRSDLIPQQVLEVLRRVALQLGKPQEITSSSDFVEILQICADNFVNIKRLCEIADQRSLFGVTEIPKSVPKPALSILKLLTMTLLCR